MRCALAVLVALALTGCRDDLLIVGDSIAKAAPFAPFCGFIVENRAKDGAQTRYALQQLRPADAVYIHVGVNDAAKLNPRAVDDMRALLATIKATPRTRFVIDRVGPLGKFASPETERVRAAVDAELAAFRAPNATVLPFMATSFSDGQHPDATGYAQHLPSVIHALGGTPCATSPP